MLDLRIWILTHPSSVWDVQQIEKDCTSALEGQNLSFEVRIVSNPASDENAMSAAEYLRTAIVAQVIVGLGRLVKNFSITTLIWQLRQLAGLSLSVVKLLSPKHRSIVALESARAHRISRGHISMWLQAASVPSRLHLFLEDDARLVDAKGFVELSKYLLVFGAEQPQFICDCSHSYSLKEIGVDASFANPGAAPRKIMDSFDFPFTNTLAASFVSPELLDRTLRVVSTEQGSKGLGIDLDLLRLWTGRSFNPQGCISSQPIFKQQSGFRSQKI